MFNIAVLDYFAMQKKPLVRINKEKEQQRKITREMPRADSRLKV